MDGRNERRQGVVEKHLQTGLLALALAGIGWQAQTAVDLKTQAAAMRVQTDANAAALTSIQVRIEALADSRARIEALQRQFDDFDKRMRQSRDR